MHNYTGFNLVSSLCSAFELVALSNQLNRLEDVTLDSKTNVIMSAAEYD